MAGQKFLIKARSLCKGGSGGHCNDVFALLFQLNDYSCFNIKVMQSLKDYSSLGVFREKFLCVNDN